MGMYTELILGVSLKEDTPNDVIEALKYMIGEVDETIGSVLISEDLY